MPYWSSSRVGAVPQGQPTSKTKKRSERFGRQQKGITMEDLKKQTALRLAQEQQHRQGRYGENGGGGRGPNPFVAPSLDPCLANDLYCNGGSGVVLPSTNSHQQQPTTVSPYPSTPNASSGSFASMDNGPGVPLMPSSGRVTPYNNSPALTPRVDTRTSPTFSYERSKSSARVQASSTPMPFPPSNYRPSTNDRPDVDSSSYTFGRTTSSTSQESATRSKQKSKLPHGLTVQELKEMTKARLQAEASVDLVDESTRRNLQTPEPFGSVPSTVNLDSRTASQASPVPPGFQSPRDAWSQDSRAEAWDNASVSTCASDAYLSSEYPSNGTQNFDDYNVTPFVRSRSYPVSSSGNCSFDVPSQVHASSNPYYDGSMGYGPNRRRAQTLSPRVGLSYVHEDRPALGDAAHISFPQAHSQPHSQPSRQRTLPVPSQSAFTPSSFRYGHNNGATNANSGIYGGGDVGSSHRQRALSTTSLPAISTTAHEFGIEQTTSISSRFASQFGAVREDSPLTSGLAEVFRGSGLSSPGLMCGTEGMGIPTISTSSSGGGHLYPGNIGDSRNRAATWSEPSSDMFSGLMCNEQLSDDLASILKLSGASEEKSGWDHLFSRPPGM